MCFEEGAGASEREWRAWFLDVPSKSVSKRSWNKLKTRWLQTASLGGTLPLVQAYGLTISTNLESSLQGSLAW